MELRGDSHPLHRAARRGHQGEALVDIAAAGVKEAQ
jgi:hypothetical protein